MSWVSIVIQKKAKKAADIVDCILNTNEASWVS